MRRELLVPKLGLTMTEGTLIEWMIKPGERFAAGQGLYVIESEKAANEVSAEAAGILLEITAKLGSSLSVGTAIGYWDDDSNAATSPGSGARRLSTPLARRLARERGIDLAGLAGSGPRGRIRARDVEEAPAIPSIVSTPTPTPIAEPPGAQSATIRPATPAEQTIARRLTASKQTIPHFYLAVEADVSAVQRLRVELNAAQTGNRFTLNHFVLAAVGRALADMPEANRVWTDDGIRDFATADVGVAVHTARGLLVPVLRDIGGRPLGDLAQLAGDAIARARNGRLSAAEMEGGAITVSNAGMHDVTYMTSIINPGQSMILGVGSVRQVFRPDENGQPALKHEMGMVLSADHRVLDGVAALKFLKRVVSAIEQPLSMLVS
jgi:pyruvate dehydrogenase E2 component (dihydrolipoamide acetyltransferase)